MSIPWAERQVRIAEMKQRELEPKVPPRVALRVARYFIGQDYDEEILPAWLINLVGVVGTVCALPYIAIMGLCSAVNRIGKILLVAASFLLWVTVWWAIDLWQLATWPRAHLEQGGGITPHKLLKLALFALGVLLCLGTFIGWAIGHHFNFVEWFPSVFVLGFLYVVATGIRF